MTENKSTMTETAVITQHPDYRTEIADILRSNLTPRKMQERLLQYHENDIAAALELLKKDERMRLYSILQTDTLASVLEYAGLLEEYMGELSIRKRVEILSRVEPGTAVEYLAQLEKAERNVLIELMDEDVRREITLLSSFDDDEIGSRMTTNYICVHSGVSVREAMHELIEQAADNDNISTLYVVDEEDMFVGAIDLKDLIIAREGTRLESITMSSYPYVYANEQIEDCIERMKEYSEDSIPVLDADNRLKGVLTSQDITQLVDDEMGEDYARLAGLSAEEDLKEPLKRSIGKRLPWLMVLLGLGLVVSSVVGMFEHVVAHLTLIVSFQSLILDMAGNVGTQSLAVTIRVLMDEQISGRQKLFLIGKEARVGLVNGLILGTLSVVCIGLYLVALKGQTVMMAFSVSLCTGIALVVSILLSSICGTAVPLAFKKMNVDPAVASGPLITTINDLVAVVSYYGLAWLLLIRVLHL
ncbi:MAG: magnesium transporter [Clostridiales bacterium]|nr:magnesium transporter [Clostridiales bacterium]MCI7702901.1 magnesium transporter [Clostridiales bacterium]MDY3763995.1 magnesium transporter [Candidatus Ventricola sp.]